MNNILSRQLAENLRAYRIRHLLSQEKLGEKLRKHRTYVGRIESGEENVSLANVVGLANLLGMHPMELLEGDLVRADRETWEAAQAPTSSAAPARPGSRLRAAADGTNPAKPKRPKRT